MALVDSYGRKIDYLRISITDHCNLNCSYCSPPFMGRHRLDRSEILTYEELATVAEAAVSGGIEKIRITGGEPLFRRGVVDFCRMLSRIPGLKCLSLTTNGVRLAPLAKSLYKAGVKRINISLDTLNRGKFRQITGHDRLDDVLGGIKAAEAAAMSPIKINTVVMRGINDDEVTDLTALTFKKPYHVRFIELMPLEQAHKGDYRTLYMPVGEIMRKIPGIESARIHPNISNPGPARMCILPGAMGKIGFIAPMSWHFCGSCNRLRLTADGKLRSCLFSDEEFDVKAPMRRGISKKKLIDMIASAVTRKPRRHHLNEINHTHTRRGMVAIGG